MSATPHKSVSTVKYRFLDHTADVLFEAFGDSYEHALENAAAALFETIALRGKLSETETTVVREEAPNLEELTNYVLSDLLSESDANEVFYKRIEVTEFQGSPSGFRIAVKAYGELYSEEKGSTHVKAVTHHRTEVHEENGQWRIQIVLDI